MDHLEPKTVKGCSLFLWIQRKKRLKMVFARVKAVLLVLPLLFAGCGRDPVEHAGSGSGGAANDEVVTLFAAASTTNAIDAIKAAFVEKTGIRVQTNYAASSTLAQQISNGAEPDVFLSANVGWADHVESNAEVTQRRDLLGNRLVIVVPADSKLKMGSAEDLLAAEVEHLALGDPDAVPAGKYAKQALIKLGLWEKVKSKVVAAKDVRHALAYVETGAAEAGIVYATDAAITDKVKVAVKIPPELTEPVCYPVLLLKRAGQGKAAAEFYDFLSSPEAACIFEQFGFVFLAEAEGDGKRLTLFLKRPACAGVC